MRLSVLGGTVASLSADTSGVVPMTRIKVEAPISTSDAGPNIHVQADLTALPGESIALEDPQTYRGLEFSVGLSQPLPRPLLLSLYAEAGFATRLAGDPLPRDKTARWGSVGLLVQTKSRAGRLALGVGGDQRLNGQWVAAVQVTGHVVLRQVKGVKVMLVGSGILGLQNSRDVGVDAPRDSVRVGIVLGM